MCDTRTLAEAVVADLARAVAERQQRIEIAVASDAGILRGDPGKLHDVIRNLVSNADHLCARAQHHPDRRVTGGRPGHGFGVG